MLIDLLDKKALEENNLDSLRSAVYVLVTSNNMDEVIQTLNNLITVSNKVRNYELLIHEAKSSINVKLSEQEFDLNALDVITKTLKVQIDAFDTAITNCNGLNITTLINSRTSLQVELNTINKASDEAIWRAEISNG